MSYGAIDEIESHRFAKAPHLWALGVGAVISGDFFGWQTGLMSGFVGLLVALVPVTVMYLLLSLSIAEMSTALPAGGGPYVFALHAIGPAAAYFAGLAEVLKLIVTCAVVVVGISSYISQIYSLDTAYGPLWWFLFYSLFVTLNIAGVEQSFRFQLAATLLSLTVLITFYIGASTQIDYNQWVVEQDWVLPDGVLGIFKGLSFVMWFYLGIEELPLVVEESIDPAKNMPIGVLLSMFTLFLLAVSTTVFNSTISPGARVIHASDAPLLEGFKAVFGDNKTLFSLSWILLIGLICSFHSFVLCMGKLLFAISRDGYLPKILAKQHPTRGTPACALVVGSGIGFSIALILHFVIGDERLGSVLVNLALIGALVSYLFQLTSFILLRRNQPNLERPYRSKFGSIGAMIAIFLCLLLFASIIYTGVHDNDYIASMIVGIGYFAVAFGFYNIKFRPESTK